MVPYTSLFPFQMERGPLSSEQQSLLETVIPDSFSDSEPWANALLLDSLCRKLD